MRPEQLQKLAALAEHLADLALAEADPQFWAGHGVAPCALDKETRAERDWCKKNAASTIALIQKIHLLGSRLRAEGEGEEEGDDSDMLLRDDIAEAEALAQRRMARLATQGMPDTAGANGIGKTRGRGR